MYQYIYIYMLYVHVIWFRKYMYVMLLVVITKRFRPNEWEHCTGILIKTNKCNFYNLSWQRGITIELFKKPSTLRKINVHFSSFNGDLFQEGHHCHIILTCEESYDFFQIWLRKGWEGVHNEIWILSRVQHLRWSN